MAMIPLAPIKKLGKKAGADRMTKKAAETLRDVLEEITFHISDRSGALAKHAKRRTLKKEDVRLAKFEIWG